MNAIIKAEKINNNTILLVEPMENTKDWEDWDMECNRIFIKCRNFNKEQNLRNENIERSLLLLSYLKDMGYSGAEVLKWIDTLPQPEAYLCASEFYPKEPK